ncbi:MAG: RagB/SusD family nutrient uptake outer membrane protein [Phycisphaeraceae bacterium]|nr:RagB/SusD family nutrient uptake outer membrane protein [Phycisphaeraceae bacterium]
MKNLIKYTTIILMVTGILFSCGEDYLEEVPLDRFSPENLLVNEDGYNAAVTAIYEAARLEHNIASSIFEYMNVGTDIARWGRPDNRGLADYTLLNSTYSAASIYWDWAYEDMLVRINLVLDGIDDPELDISDEARASFKGEALFFRAYTFNFLTNIYGDVPIVSERLQEPKFDFVRSPRQEVLEFAAADLEAAVGLLDLEVEDGRIPRAAAYHLLSEVYISLGMETGDASYYDQSITAASMVIDKQAGDYEIMTERFGPASSEPGDVFSDVHAYGQINRSDGNKEVLWAWQFELYILGGSGNQSPRYWAPEYDKLKTPNNVSNIDDNEHVRGIGVNSPTNYVKYGIWALDPNDMRNSEHNIKRTFYYNNPADPEYYGKEIKTGYGPDDNLYILEDDGVTLTNIKLDTVRGYYPWIEKISGYPRADSPNSGSTAKDFSRMRVAETYLLRAEAYFRKGELDNAADDINVVRARANASLISGADVTEDFILDERARELLVEEPRLRTLIRMGRLVDRVRTYNSAPYAPGGPSAGTTIADHNEYWPIPQSVIDANAGAEMTQNPGYPGSE